MTESTRGNSGESHDAATGLPPLDTAAVLWVAAIDLLPIEERIAWVEKMTARVAEFNAARAEAFRGT